MWDQAIASWVVWLKAAGRPQTTIQLRTYQLERFAAGAADPWELTTEDLTEWLARHELSAETRRSYRSALRSFYSWAYASGRMAEDPAALLPPIRHTVHPPRPTPESIVQSALLRAEPRVQLMILLAGAQGLRRAEIAVVHSRDVVEDLGGWSLRIHGKGGKIRVVPLLDRIARDLRQLEPGWAFPGDDHGHLSPRWVGTLVRRALDTAGWTTHTLRHRFATVTYRGTRDLLTVQELMGHAKTETTRGYVKLPDDALRAAIHFAA